MGNLISNPGDKPILEALEPRLLLSGTAGEQAIELFHTTAAVFIENQGQWTDESIRFIHKGQGANIAHTDSGLVFELFREVAGDDAPAAPDDLRPDMLDAEPADMESIRFSAAFDGANTVTPVGIGQAQTRFNFFLGDQAQWRQDVPSYEIVAYEGLYDGIDLHTWGQRDSLKYEFHVAPGADFSQISVSYNGIEGLEIDQSGALHIRLSGDWGQVVDDTPYIYQVIDGQQVEIAGGYRLIDGDTYAFEVTGDYDPARQLIIDPDLDWSTYLGSSEIDVANGIAVHTSGGVVVTGYAGPVGFSGTANAYKGGQQDAFVAKVTSDGFLEWATYIGGSSVETGNSIAVDASGNIFVAGFTGSADFSGAGNAFNGGVDAFVTKLAGDGVLEWATYIGGSERDRGYGIAVDSSDSIFLTGNTGSADFSGVSNTYNGGDLDAFAAKMTSEGTLIWAKFIGGEGGDDGYGVALDPSGDAFVVGETGSSSFSEATNAFNGGSQDAFVTKVTSDGDLSWSVYIGGDGWDFGHDIAVDASGAPFVTGRTHSNNLSGAINAYNGGDSDGFVAKVTSAGDLDWATYLGGSDSDGGNGVTVDALGQIFVTGAAYSNNFSGADNTHYGGGPDAFVAKIAGNGAVKWATYLGGSGYDMGLGIAVDSSGSVYVTGYTSSSDFSEANNSRIASTDCFVAKIDGAATAITTTLTEDFTIGAGDMDFEGHDVVVQGCTVTIDGEHDFQSLTLLSGATVTHTAAVGDGLKLNIAGNVTVESGTSIDADGLGYGPLEGPGSPQPYSRPGAGYGGVGGDGYSQPTVYSGGGTYGSITEPTDFGSGSYQTRGAGAIRLVVVGELTVDGEITADGLEGYSSHGGSSGGSIWITAGALQGTGLITADGGVGPGGGSAGGGGGGGGRIAVSYDTSTFSGVIQSVGADGWQGDGGAGTVYVRESGTDGRLVVDNKGRVGEATPIEGSNHFSELSVLAGGYATVSVAGLLADSLTIVDGGTVEIASPTVVGNATIESGGVLTTSEMVPLSVTVLGDMEVAAGSLITADGLGYGPQEGAGALSLTRPGAGYGGVGGDGYSQPTVYSGGGTYGSITEPTDFGSGSYQTYGAGAIRLVVGGELTVDGEITADGLEGASGHGGSSGGSIWITAGALQGTGLITADGGVGPGGGSAGGGGGGGGRIAVSYDTSTFSGVIQSVGADGWQGDGGAGTVYVRESGTDGRLVVDNKGRVGEATPIEGSDHFSELSVLAGGYATVSVAGLLADDLTIGGGGTVEMASPTVVGNATIESGGVLTASEMVPLSVTVLGDMEVTAGSLITADGAGHGPLEGPGMPPYSRSGAGHGGAGGDGYSQPTVYSGGGTYGSTTEPTDFGSGSYQTRGAGAIRLVVGGELTVDGEITADGLEGYSSHGGSSGGSIWITAGALQGTGLITADGGVGPGGGSAGGGGGGGGRIAVYYDTSTFSGVIQSVGGDGWQGDGGEGTIHLADGFVQQGAFPSIEFIHSGDTLPSYGFGQEVELQFRVTNYGPDTLVNGLVTLNVFADGENWDNDDDPLYNSHDPLKLLEGLSDLVIPPLGPGQSVPLTFHFVLPSSVATVQYTAVAIVRGGADFDHEDTDDFDDLQYTLDDTSPGIATSGLNLTAYLPAFGIEAGTPEFGHWERLTDGVVTAGSIKQPDVLLLDRENRVVVRYPKVSDMAFLEFDIAHAESFAADVVTLRCDLNGAPMGASVPGDVLHSWLPSVRDDGDIYSVTWTYQLKSDSTWYNPLLDTSELYFAARTILTGDIAGPEGRPQGGRQTSWLTEGLRMEGGTDTYARAIAYSTPFQMDSRDMGEVILEGFGESGVTALGDIAGHFLGLTAALPVLGPILAITDVIATYVQTVGDYLNDPVVAIPFADGELEYGEHGLSAPDTGVEYGIFVGVDLPRTYPSGLSDEYADLSLLVWRDGWARSAHESKTLLVGDDLKALIDSATPDSSHVRSLLIAPKDNALFNGNTAPTSSVEVEAHTRMKVGEVLGVKFWSTLSDRTTVSLGGAADASQPMEFEGDNAEWITPSNVFPAIAEILGDEGSRYYHLSENQTNSDWGSEDIWIGHRVDIPSTAHTMAIRYAITQVDDSSPYDVLEVWMRDEEGQYFASGWVEATDMLWDTPLTQAMGYQTVAIDVTDFAGKIVQLAVELDSDGAGTASVSIDRISFSPRDVVRTEINVPAAIGGTDGSRALAYDENGDGLPDRIEDPLSDFEAPVVSVDETLLDIDITETKMTVSLQVPKESGWICYRTPLAFMGQREIDEVRTSDGRVISTLNWWIEDNMLYVLDDPDTTYLLVYDKKYSASDTHTGSIDFNRSEYVGATSTATVIVADQDMDVTPGAFNDSLTVSIVSPTDPIGEVVVLNETLQPGVFSNEVGFETAATPGNGLLHVAPDDEITATYLDAEDSDGLPAEILAGAVFDVVSVDGRHVFYNNSSADGDDPSAGTADDGAIDVDRHAFLPGQTPESANYSSYYRGINGIMIDIDHVPGTLTDADFGVRVNDAANPNTWSDGPAPTVDLRRGAGVGGADRVTLIWPDGSIVNRWIEVTVKATGNTGLATDDVFYFGNVVADCDGDGAVGVGDYEMLVGELGRRGDDLVGDVNRDGRVGLEDFAAIRANFGTVVPAPDVSGGTVEGQVWYDASGDGVRDGGEAGMGDPSVRVYVDLNASGGYDDGEPNAWTGADGAYAITGVPAGSYSVAQVTPAGHEQTSPRSLDSSYRFVSVGQVDNAPDTTSYGAVDHEYDISKFEITAGQYCEFLNAVAATDTYGLYNSSMWSSSYGCKIERAGDAGGYSYTVAADRADRPVNYVSWGDAARLANWLTNGRPAGPQAPGTTEDGSYVLGGAVTGLALMAITRHEDARYVIPTEDEWYKAAYYDSEKPGGAGYWNYPTAGDTAPTAETPAGTDMTNGSANYSSAGGGAYYTTEVGAYTAKPSASAYGTFDQGGNVHEWNETVTQASERGTRGGAFDNPVASALSVSNRYDNAPDYESPFIGFRVADLSGASGSSLSHIVEVTAGQATPGVDFGNVLLPAAAPGAVVESGLGVVAVTDRVTSVNPGAASDRSTASSNQLTANDPVAIDLLGGSLSVDGYVAEPRAVMATRLQRAATSAYDLRPLGNAPATDAPVDDLLADVLAESALAVRL